MRQRSRLLWASESSLWTRTATEQVSSAARLSRWRVGGCQAAGLPEQEPLTVVVCRTVVVCLAVAVAVVGPAAAVCLASSAVPRQSRPEAIWLRCCGRRLRRSPV